jgi:hypothetical protein
LADSKLLSPINILERNKNISPHKEKVSGDLKNE